MIKQFSNTLPLLFDSMFGPDLLVYSESAEKDIDITRTLNRIRCRSEKCRKDGGQAFLRLGNQSREWVPGFLAIINILNRQMQDGLISKLRDVCDSSLSLSMTAKFLDEVSKYSSNKF